MVRAVVSVHVNVKRTERDFAQAWQSIGPSLLPLDGGGRVGVSSETRFAPRRTSPPPQPSPIEGEGVLTRTADRPPRRPRRRPAMRRSRRSRRPAPGRSATFSSSLSCDEAAVNPHQINDKGATKPCPLLI